LVHQHGTMSSSLVQQHGTMSSSFVQQHGTMSSSWVQQHGTMSSSLVHQHGTMSSSWPCCCTHEEDIVPCCCTHEEDIVPCCCTHEEDIAPFRCTHYVIRVSLWIHWYLFMSSYCWLNYLHFTHKMKNQKYHTCKSNYHTITTTTAPTIQYVYRSVHYNCLALSYISLAHSIIAVIIKLKVTINSNYSTPSHLFHFITLLSFCQYSTFYWSVRIKSGKWAVKKI
jgi:hypothetical protein